MDYVKQLEAFYSSLNYNSISTNALAVYSTVLHIAHLANRYDELSIANTRLLDICNLTLKEFQTARNELITKKYIDYQKGSNKNNAPKYSIIKLYSERDNQNRTTTGVSTGATTGVSGGVSGGVSTRATTGVH